MTAPTLAPVDTTPARRRRDAGVTVVELLLAVTLAGLLATVISAAVIVVLRSEDGVARTIGESHDLQQTINYFPSDIAVAPRDPAAYRTGGAPACGAGRNVVSVTYTSGDAVAYTLTETGPQLTLDRHECDADGAAATTVNVADLLDRTVDEPATATLNVDDTGEVTSVVMQLVRAGGRPSDVVGVPRDTETIPEIEHVARGVCTSEDPLAATHGFLTFVEGEATLSGTTQVYKALGLGGTLTFHGAQVASHGGNDTYQPASVGIYAHDIDWAASTGTLSVQGNPNGHVVLTGEVEGVDITTATDGPITYIRPHGTTGAPQIKAQHGQLKPPNPGHTISFGASFAELRACSEAMSQLPGGCTDCATHVVPLHINSNPSNLIPYAGVGNLRLDLTPGVTNVLNIGESRLAAIGEITPAWLDATPADTDAVVVNVVDDDTSNNRVDDDGNPVSVVRLANPMRFQNYTTNVLWNFAGVDEVQVPNGSWGTVYAPFSHVTVGNNVQGNLVAASVEITGGVINEARSFEGAIRWN